MNCPCHENAFWKRDLALILLFGAVLFFPFLGERDIWTSAEARVAQVARQMRVSGEWIIPYMGDDVRLKKPPLAYWLTALATMPFDTADENGGTVVHVDEFNTRIPNAFCALGLMCVIYLFGASLGGRACGWYSALTLGTTGIIWWQARMTGIEMPQLFFNTLALYTWWRYFAGGRQKAGWLVLTYAALALSGLAKGIGPLVDGLIIWSYLLIQGEPLRCPNLKHHGLALLAFLAIGLPWPIRVLLEVSDASETWIKESTGRLGGFDHLKHPFYFFTKILGDGQPWILLAFPAVLLLQPTALRRFLQTLAFSLLLLLNLLILYVARRHDASEGSAWIVFWVAVCAAGALGAFFLLRGRILRGAECLTPWLSPGSSGNVALPCAWMLSTLVFFSLFTSKKSYYILPIYPALALMFGFVLSSLQNRLVHPRIESSFYRFCRVFGIVMIVCGPLFLAAYGVATFYLPRFEQYGGHLPQILVIVGMVVAAGWLIRKAAQENCARRVFRHLLITTVIVMGIYLSMIKEINEYKGAKRLCLDVKPYLQPEDKLITYWISGLPILQFYLDRDIDRIWDELDLYVRLSSPGRVVLLIQPVDEADLGDMYAVASQDPAVAQAIESAGFCRIGHHAGYELYRYRPANPGTTSQTAIGAALDGKGIEYHTYKALLYPLEAPLGHDGELWLVNQPPRPGMKPGDYHSSPSGAFRQQKDDD